MSLPSDSKERKTYPMYEGLLKYFPDALAEVSHLSHVGNEQHNPGQPLHWAKEKSTDHADCIIRHLTDALKTENVDTTTKELTAVAWRALALLQIHCETMEGKRKLTQPVGYPTRYPNTYLPGEIVAGTQTIEAGADVAGRQPPHRDPNVWPGLPDAN